MPNRKEPSSCVAPGPSVRVTSRAIHVEMSLEPPPSHGDGEVLDVLVWGALSRSRAAIDVRVHEAEGDLAITARAAFPEANDEIRVEAMPLERAVFGEGADGPDQIRLRFRIVATTHSSLQRWRALLQENLKALGIGRDGAAGHEAPLGLAAA